MLGAIALDSDNLGHNNHENAPARHYKVLVLLIVFVTAVDLSCQFAAWLANAADLMVNSA